MQAFPLFNMPVTCLCLSLAKPSQKPLSKDPGKQRLWAVSRERDRRRVRNDSKQAKDWHRMLSLSLYHFVSLINEHLEGREPIHLYVTRVHHMFSDGGRLFTVLPVEDFIFSPTAKWPAVPPCGRNVSPSSINIRFHHVNLLWTTNVGIPSSSGSFECLCVAGPPRLDLRVAWHGQSCSWLATGT